MTKLKYTLLAGAAIALLASPASAALQISFTDGATTVSCVDQAACDVNPILGQLRLADFSVGQFSIDGNASKQVIGTVNRLSTSDLTITNNGGKAGLSMVVSATGYHSPITGVDESAVANFEGGVGSTFALGFFVDPLNTQGANPLNTPGTEIFSTSGTVTADPQAFLGNHPNTLLLSDTFSMTESAEWTLVAGADIQGFGQAMATSVPELQTWAMFGVGLGLVGLVGLRKSKQSVSIA